VIPIFHRPRSYHRSQTQALNQLTTAARGVDRLVAYLKKQPKEPIVEPLKKVGKRECKIGTDKKRDNHEIVSVSLLPLLLLNRLFS